MWSLSKKFYRIVFLIGLIYIFMPWFLMDTKKSVVCDALAINPPKSAVAAQKQKCYTHKTVKRNLHGKPAIVNILTINPSQSNIIIKPSFGSSILDKVSKVADIVNIENAVAGINASFFKPVNGKPLGASVINGDLKTGPLYKRVSLGITDNNCFKMAKLGLYGTITIGDKLKLGLFNINQPVFSSKNFTIFTDEWGKHTPSTKSYYSHIVVYGNRVQYVKNSSVPIPEGGYVIVGPHKFIAGHISRNAPVFYEAYLSPRDWNDIKYVLSGGPYLVRDGKIFIDKQNFTRRFLWSKEPRTAVGYTKSGVLLLVTVDGRHKGFSEGATITELAQIMHDLGAYNAMNLDGGSSTQMVVGGKLVNYPTVKGGTKVTNALVIVLPD